MSFGSWFDFAAALTFRCIEPRAVECLWDWIRLISTFSGSFTGLALDGQQDGVFETGETSVVGVVAAAAVSLALLMFKGWFNRFVKL